MPDIVLRDHAGSPIEYPGVDIIRVAGLDGEAKTFGSYDPEVLTPNKLLEGVTVGDVAGAVVIPETMENVPVTLDFSGGDQTITAPDGALVKSAIIQKPETLLPENILEGIDIAGIIGTLASGGSSVEFKTGTFTGYSYMATPVPCSTVPDLVLVMFDGSSNSYLQFAVSLSLRLQNFLGLSYGVHSCYGNNWFHSTQCITSATDERYIRYMGSDLYFGGSKYKAYGNTYRWIAINGLTEL